LDQNVGFDGSGHDADDLGIGGELAKRLLGAGSTVVDADLKDAPPDCRSVTCASGRSLRLRFAAALARGS
jgi:hypothetical protein